jgi:hypothetical protein
MAVVFGYFVDKADVLLARRFLAEWAARIFTF